jgi:hypothetical protein
MKQSGRTATDATSSQAVLSAMASPMKIGAKERATAHLDAV